ncbi:hypothetical protein A4X06_0g6551 [Tilletia controversa]|uniref:Uncharacterized protein n=2 Tax=Tilletia TaxID=13289 RepID=A0A8X7SUI6_9BASI|nr:hypothetical protein CF328_g5514 [Tilletia controversa]KAE8192170.1 hypothetical protein CF335_g5904 [Tilletia laevis]KAE8243104.1 hypothetical protein A4X06_0g6551 [Tilletia controversa]KAE8256653.1 hypothetical protein A4X03_0g5191 [Tilletia caries]
MVHPSTRSPSTHTSTHPLTQGPNTSVHGSRIFAGLRDPRVRSSGFLSSAAVVRSSLSHEQVPSVLPFVKSTVSAHTTIPTSRPTNAIALLSWVLNKGQHPRPQATLALVGKGTAPRTGGPLFMMIKGRGGWEAN